MASRGPDGAGLWLSADGRVGLGHRRLAIIAPGEGGAQPMRIDTPRGALVVSFNGEIYNHAELRRELEARGRRLRSGSDTEVLLHLYDELGVDMLPRLRGMYAFALWDEGRRRLVACRDPFGIKPLYVADDGRTVRLASQVKALLAGGGVDTAPSPAGHVGYHVMGHVPEPFTLYAAVRSVEPGSALVVEAGGRAATRRIVDVARTFAEAEPVETSAAARAELMAEALADSVAAHLVADVPVGVFLSAGKDSNAILAAAAAARKGSAPIRTVTLGFAEFRGLHEDEVPLAEATAAHLGTDQRTVTIGKADFEAERERLLEAMDQPSLDGVNSYFVARAAAGSGLKVALSGVGGDELLGGYHYFPLVPRVARRTRLLPAPLGRPVAWLLRPVGRRVGQPKLPGMAFVRGDLARAYILCRCLNEPFSRRSPLPVADVDAKAGLEELALESRVRAIARDQRTPHAAVAMLETLFYMRDRLLRDTDWASMAHGLEVRVPLVDVDLFRRLAPVVNARTPIDKSSLDGLFRRAGLTAIIHRPKSGFVTPVNQWLAASAREGSRPWANTVAAHFRRPPAPLAGRNAGDAAAAAAGHPMPLAS